jgi:hypothetical protein
MIKKNIIRKIILEEILKKINNKMLLNESPIALVPAMTWAGIGVLISATDFFKEAETAGNIKHITDTDLEDKHLYKKFKDQIANIENIVLPDDTKARELAQRLEAATLDYSPIGGPVKTFLSTEVGLGTDEDEIKKVISDSKSQLGFAKVCVLFKELTNKTFEKVYQDEIDIPAEQKEYVINPILGLPFAVLDVDGTETPYSAEEFSNLLKEAEAAKKAEGEAADKKAASDACSPPTPLEKPYIENIIKVMNAYAKKYEDKKETFIGKVTTSTTWDESVQKLWLEFAPHALLNCDLFEGFKPGNLDGVKSWPKMSAQMISKYPGYTPDPRGCLAFCLDAFCCKAEFGLKAPETSSSKRSSSSGGLGRRRGATADTAPSGRSKSSFMDNVDIKLNLTQENFTQSGFSIPGGNIDEIFAKSILNYRDQDALRNGMPKTSINVFMELNDEGNKVVEVKRVVFDGSQGPFKKRVGQINRGIFDVAQRMKFPTSGAYKDSFDSGKRKIGRGKFIRVTFTFSAGRY